MVAVAVAATAGLVAVAEADVEAVADPVAEAVGFASALSVSSKMVRQPSMELGEPEPIGRVSRFEFRIQLVGCLEKGDS